MCGTEGLLSFLPDNLGALSAAVGQRGFSALYLCSCSELTLRVHCRE